MRDVLQERQGRRDRRGCCWRRRSAGLTRRLWRCPLALGAKLDRAETANEAETSTSGTRGVSRISIGQCAVTRRGEDRLQAEERNRPYHLTLLLWHSSHADRRPLAYSELVWAIGKINDSTYSAMWRLVKSELSYSETLLSIVSLSVLP
jgi:hypothetical protein